MKNKIVIPVLLTVSLAAFCAIARSAFSGGWAALLDQWVLGHAPILRTAALTAAMQGLTVLGSFPAVALCSLAAAAWFAFNKMWRRAALMPAAVLSGNLFHNLLKIQFHRPRPAADAALATAHGWSFPSGHTMDSVICYGMLAWLLALQVKFREEGRAAIAFSAASVVFVVGFSRVYLQVHYASDVLAGFAGGMFWLTFWIAVTGPPARES